MRREGILIGWELAVTPSFREPSVDLDGTRNVADETVPPCHYRNSLASWVFGDSAGGCGKWEAIGRNPTPTLRRTQTREDQVRTRPYTNGEIARSDATWQRPMGGRPWFEDGRNRNGQSRAMVCERGQFSRRRGPDRPVRRESQRRRSGERRLVRLRTTSGPSLFRDKRHLGMDWSRWCPRRRRCRRELRERTSHRPRDSVRSHVRSAHNGPILLYAPSKVRDERRHHRRLSWQSGPSGFEAGRRGVGVNRTVSEEVLRGSIQYPT